MYKLVAIDLDGTLLNSQKQISDNTKAIIKRAIDKGIKVVVCSGRIFAGARIFARQLCTREPVIACNGAIIKDMDTHEVLYENFLGHEDCLKIVDICHRFDVYFHIYIDDTMYTEKLDHSSLFYWNKNMELSLEDRINIEVVKDMNPILMGKSGKALKFVVISDELNLLSRVRSEVQGIKTVKAMSSNYNNFEIVNHSIDKGCALKLLSEKMGVERSEIIAIGDNENDYSMIRFAGLGIAMGNAEDIIKAEADYVTLTNDEDGVAEVFKRFVNM